MHIEKVLLLKDRLDSVVRAAFSEYETRDLQQGIDWLSNMAATALDDGEEAVIYIARRSTSDFIACPIKLNLRSGHAQSLSTFYSSSYSPVVVSTSPEPLFLALFRHLARVDRIATLTLSPMDVDSPVFAIVRNALDQAGWRGVHDFFCFGNWIHDIDCATYQTYLASRPSQLRNTIARRTRQFLAAGRGRLELVTGGDALESAIEQFVGVYNASWKRTEPYPDFIPHLLRLSARRGWLRLGIASYDNRPVASQIWLVHAGTAYIFKLAYRQDYSQLSPGTVLTAYMMEYVIDHNAVSRIDYLSGDDSYKQDWMSARRERQGIAAYNARTLRGFGHFLGRAIYTLAKQLKRTSRSTQAASRRLPD